MKLSSSSVRIGLAVAVIVGTVAWLAWSGYSSSKSYYVTIPELSSMGTKAYTSNLRVDGFVKPGTIQQDGTNVIFVMNQYESHSPKAAQGRLLKVEYKGSEPPPDTFKDDAQALAIGTYGRDGVFHANELQAKCASKYAPTTPTVEHPAQSSSSSPRAAVSMPSTPGSAN